MLKNFTYDGKEGLPLPKNYVQAYVNSWRTSQMNDLNLYVYVKK